MYRYETPVFRQRSSRFGSNYGVFESRKVRRNLAKRPCGVKVWDGWKELTDHTGILHM